MAKHRRVGLAKLAAASSFDLGDVTSEKIGFQLSPRLNAAGRTKMMSCLGAKSGFNDIETRDGTTLSANVRLPIGSNTSELTRMFILLPPSSGSFVVVPAAVTPGILFAATDVGLWQTPIPLVPSLLLQPGAFLPYVMR